MIEKQLWSLWNESFFAQTFDRRTRADLIKFVVQFAGTDAACIAADGYCRRAGHVNTYRVDPRYREHVCITAMSVLCQRGDSCSAADPTVCDISRIGPDRRDQLLNRTDGQ